MKRVLSIAAILAIPLLLDSCALGRRALQTPGRLLQAVGRSITATGDAPVHPVHPGRPAEAHLALRHSTPPVRSLGF